MLQKPLRRLLLSRLRLTLQPKLLCGALYGLLSRTFGVDLRRASSNPRPAIEVFKVLSERCNNRLEDGFFKFLIIKAGVPNIRRAL